MLEVLFAVLSVCVHEPRFPGQTKDRLVNPEVLAPADLSGSSQPYLAVGSHAG